MAKIHIITHQFDRFLVRNRRSGQIRSPYLLDGVLRHLKTMGHVITVTAGSKSIVADAALLHVDSTIVSDEYLDVKSKYPRTINFGTRDISKRRVSGLQLVESDDWKGRVIVKSNYNNNAAMESLHNERAERQGLKLPHPEVMRGPPYRLLNSIAQVDAQTWADPSFIVERFVTEPDPAGGFALRTWVFMGSRERCTRTVTSGRISKAANVLRYEPTQVPDQLRAERARLGFDYGKFDFVMSDGQPFLLDANRTPGVADALQPLIDKGSLNLAEGLHELLIS